MGSFSLLLPAVVAFMVAALALYTHDAEASCCCGCIRCMPVSCGCMCTGPAQCIIPPLLIKLPRTCPCCCARGCCGCCGCGGGGRRRRRSIAAGPLNCIPCPAGEALPSPNGTLSAPSNDDAAPAAAEPATNNEENTAAAATRAKRFAY